MIGGLYALFAAGLSLIFGVMRLVNIAYGDLIVLAAYVALVVTQTLGIGPLTALYYREGAGHGRDRAMRCSGCAQPHAWRGSPAAASRHLRTFPVIIQNGLLTVFTADSVKLQAGPIEVATIRLAEGLYVGVLLLPGIRGRGRRHRWPAVLIFYRTAIGRAFRATSDDPAVAQLMGLDNRHCLRLGHGAVACGGRDCRLMFLAGARQLRSSQVSGAAHLRLRSRHHRRPRQSVGHARGRIDPRRCASAVGAYLDPGWQNPRRAHRVS